MSLLLRSWLRRRLLAVAGPAAESPVDLISKFDRDGRRVPTYGEGGTLRFVLQPYPDFSIAEVVATDASGNIFVGGSAAHSATAFVVA